MKRKKEEKEVKAAKKRRSSTRKFEEVVWRCNECSEIFDEEEEEEVLWIECDECGRWFHVNCTELKELSPSM